MPHGSAWFFFDTTGKLLPKSSSDDTCNKLLRAGGCSELDLQDALDDMIRVAYDEAGRVVRQLR